MLEPIIDTVSWASPRETIYIGIALLTSSNSIVKVPTDDCHYATDNRTATVMILNVYYHSIIPQANNVMLTIYSMQCERSKSLPTFLRQITTGVNKVALLGCGCSTATEPVAEISGFWNITHVSIIMI